ncbi:hypothetical protein GCM10007416_07450 [Kroppenstedtia guangzhouensis]|uniref:Uncharacterized protein n=1 Tax=Kroppenstedtia guangzhouensis TaxID=1274356 RepID=A0ABQ1G572_9BACL|nr:hypothetical protein [Kroppenstedtia guangzhouensis]GGA36994.1 hypothetical protein GCM10007416_07450 [Kroppenstedtia guangzhouensis]
MRIIGGSYREWKSLGEEEQMRLFNRAMADYHWKMSRLNRGRQKPFASKLIDFSGLNHCYPMQETILH